MNEAQISLAFFIAYTQCYRLVFGRGGLAHMWAGCAASGMGATTQRKKLAYNGRWLLSVFAIK